MPDCPYLRHVAGIVYVHPYSLTQRVGYTVQMLKNTPIDCNVAGHVLFVRERYETNMLL
jgi:hypothetical protein